MNDEQCPNEISDLIEANIRYHEAMSIAWRESLESPAQRQALEALDRRNVADRALTRGIELHYFSESLNNTVATREREQTAELRKCLKCLVDTIELTGRSGLIDFTGLRDSLEAAKTELKHLGHA